jgi:midasin
MAAAPLPHSSLDTSPEASALVAAVAAAAEAAMAARTPFEWVDGPLVAAMKTGGVLLIDEINLAEDAVLERLNSVLEPGRTLLLAEKGGPVTEMICAHEDFRLVATMNPGGDHGKRELSPALSNRLTQVSRFLSCFVVDSTSHTLTDSTVVCMH